MSRIATRFGELRVSGRKALIPFITAGDPKPWVTVPTLHALVAAGADIIELGVPFSDPMADGPVIQRASERALKHNTSLRDVFGMVREFRKKDQKTPIVLMGYLNPIEVMGYEAFAIAAGDAGVDGVLTVDLPPEEGADLIAALRAKDIDPIFLLAPTTDAQRMARICEAASGFLYYVSVKGITGAKNLDIDGVAQRLDEVRKHTRLPLGVGFGIGDAESAARVARIADAVIVGSALVSRMEGLQDKPDRISAEITTFIGGLRRAIDSQER